MVKTPPIPRDGGRGTEAIRLIQRPAAYRPGDEFEAPRDTDTKRSKSKVAFFDPNELNTSVANRIFATNPILKVEAASFFLGAANTVKPRKRGEWEYRPQWVFSDAAKARKTMEAMYSSYRRVLVLQLPALVCHMPNALLLVAELNTNEPFRRAFYQLKPPYGDKVTRHPGREHLQEGLFCPKTLGHAVAFFLTGTSAAAKQSWLFALAPVRKKGRAFPPLPLTYTIASREYVKKPRSSSNLAAKVKLSDLRWTYHTLGTSDEPMDKTLRATGEPMNKVRVPQNESMDTYARRLVALRFP